MKMEIAKITSKGQITLPKVVRTDMKLKSGSNVVFIKSKEGYMIFSEADVEKGMIKIDVGDVDDEEL